MRVSSVEPQGAAVTRSEPLSPDRAIAGRAGTGVAAAPPRVDSEWLGGAGSEADAVRRELARLTALLRRHFSQGGEDSLLPALANTKDPAAAASARQFLDQIRALAETLEADAGRWEQSPEAAGAFADFRRETMALLAGVEERLAE